MNTSALEQFSQQLAQWIGHRLTAGVFPFRRVEALTALPGPTSSQCLGLVFWINRSSLLAGGLLLIPAKVDDQALTAGRRLAAEFGLGQFVTWGARQVTFWRTAGERCEELARFSLPGARKIAPADFSVTLDALLARLKASCVDSALPASELPAEYFARLCLLALKDLEPDLNDAALQAAGGERPDSWTATAPRGKAWLSLWRLLMVLWHDRLVPGTQPERLEQALGYALADIGRESAILQPAHDEPPLVESAAVRFHQLGGRLRQLAWSSDPPRALRIVELLLQQVAVSLHMPEVDLPWPIETLDLSVNLQEPPDNLAADSVAPRCYLAGQTLRHHLKKDPAETPRRVERVTELPGGWSGRVVAANLQDSLPPPRVEQERLMLELRRVWPNRRFQLPRQTPRWVWETIYLGGLACASESLHLILPAEWARAPGLDLCWELLANHYRIRRFGRQCDGHCILHLTTRQSPLGQPELYRPDGRFLLPAAAFEAPAPGFLQLCSQAPAAVLELIVKAPLLPVAADGPAWSADQENAAYLFTRTTLGRALWRVFDRQAALPALTEISAAIRNGLPLPGPDRLAALAGIGWQPGQTLPATATLDRRLALEPAMTDAPETQEEASAATGLKRIGNSRTLRNEILGRVFQDGVPLFPEHYLMAHYRPELQEYQLAGPLRQTGVFFDRIELCGPDPVPFYVSGTSTAEALILVSLSGRTRVNLPVDPELTEQLLDNYRQDLHRLWEQLVRECRRRLPRQQAALSLARRLWREQALPPVAVQAG